MQCKKCGAVFEEGVFCPECGEKYEDELNTGKENDVIKTEKVNTIENTVEDKELVKKGKKKNDVVAILALVFGIISILSCGIIIIPEVVGIVLSIWGIVRKKNNKMSIVALILSIVSIVLVIVFGIWMMDDMKSIEEKENNILNQDISWTGTVEEISNMSEEELTSNITNKHVEIKGTVTGIEQDKLVLMDNQFKVTCDDCDTSEIENGDSVTVEGVVLENVYYNLQELSINKCSILDVEKNENIEDNKQENDNDIYVEDNKFNNSDDLVDEKKGIVADENLPNQIGDSFSSAKPYTNNEFVENDISTYLKVGKTYAIASGFDEAELLDANYLYVKAFNIIGYDQKDNSIRVAISTFTNNEWSTEEVKYDLMSSVKDEGTVYSTQQSSVLTFLTEEWMVESRTMGYSLGDDQYQLVTNEFLNSCSISIGATYTTEELSLDSGSGTTEELSSGSENDTTEIDKKKNVGWGSECQYGTFYKKKNKEYPRVSVTHFDSGEIWIGIYINNSIRIDENGIRRDDGTYYVKTGSWSYILSFNGEGQLKVKMEETGDNKLVNAIDKSTYKKAVGKYKYFEENNTSVDEVIKDAYEKLEDGDY